MTKQERALEIIDRLKREYPDAGCTLDYNEAWKLLVSLRLAAQCTDARVNVVVEKLYEKYPDVESLAAADVDDIEKIVHPCGLGPSKARDISACMKVLRDQYGGGIPQTFEELLKLPGVGRKSANLVMGDVFGKPAIVTDTHCIRLVNRPLRWTRRMQWVSVTIAGLPKTSPITRLTLVRPTADSSSSSLKVCGRRAPY